MKIEEITHQYRRDFSATLKCEGCNFEQALKGGYDDRNYHDNVIPTIPCKSCGKSRKDLGITHPPTPTKYQPWEVV